MQLVAFTIRKGYGIMVIPIGQVESTSKCEQRVGRGAAGAELHNRSVRLLSSKNDIINTVKEFKIALKVYQTRTNRLYSVKSQYLAYSFSIELKRI